jgi:high-affinity Fe2+/Pb2+ permease
MCFFSKILLVLFWSKSSNAFWLVGVKSSNKIILRLIIIFPRVEITQPHWPIAVAAIALWRFFPLLVVLRIRRRGGGRRRKKKMSVFSSSGGGVKSCKLD